MPIRNHNLLVTFVGFALIALGGCKSGDAGSSPPPITPITDNIFPLVAGHQYVYTGYLVEADSIDMRVADQPTPYRTSWTLLGSPPAPSGIWFILDSTTVGTSTSVHLLPVRRDSTTGDLFLRQTLGPFYRRVGIPYADTGIWVRLISPAHGIGNIWTAFDTTETITLGEQTAQVHLEVFGETETQETITDSSSAHNSYTAYRVRIWRKVTASGFVVQDDATTARLWLVKDIGPVQVTLAGDPENFGHFRVLQSKNFSR